MESNTHSDGLVALAAVVDQLAAQDRDGLADHVRAQRVLGLRRLLDRLEGHWLAEVDARGAAGAEQDVRFGSTAGWLRTRLHAGATTAGGWVKTARALFRSPLTGTAQALREGELSVAHASVLAAGTHDLPGHTTAEAEPVLVEAAGRLDPPRLRRLATHLRLVADPDDADRQAQRRHEQRGLWLSPTLDNMIAVDGLLEAEAGQILLSALEPLARPACADDTRTGGQRRADALAELARRQLEAGRSPRTGGVRPQLTVLVDLDSLVGHRGTLGGVTDTGPLGPEACQRLACDGAVPPVLGGGPHPAPGAGPPESSNPPNAPPWPYATAAVSSRAVTARWPGARPTILSIGWMAAPPTWTTWSCCAGPTIGRCMRAAGDWPEALTGGRPPPHRTDPTEDSRPPPDQRAPTATPVPGGRRGLHSTRALMGPVLELHTR
jgi:hypothetical protein